MPTVDDLARALLQATRARRVTWKSTADDKTYSWSSDDTTVLISDVGTADKPIIEIELRDRFGAMIEEKRFSGTLVTARNYFRLYDEARRNARGTDQVIAKLLAEIENNDSDDEEIQEDEAEQHE